MPNIHITYTPNLPAQENLETLALNIHHAVSPIVASDVDNFKSYILPVARSVIGRNVQEKAVLHIDLRMYAGRTEEVKKQVADIIISEAKKLFTTGAGGPLTQISVEVRNIDKDHSHKVMING